ncbi:hypothetical protein D9615_003085 [Tricholomella constricta]|uniref:Uncharacterized protein n=1 Tax=Tricholomella constricta TaxID=117010 RepID=A0A8H5HFR2_9AGAR|nr:hypothetical protein D9615_003085 [Tricholomella constricta]
MSCSSQSSTLHIPFRLSCAHTTIPRLDNSTDPIYTIATKFLPKLIPNGPAFAQSLLEEYVRKAVEELPDSMSSQPKIALRWAKQNVREQLVILEVLFWTMWGYVPYKYTIASGRGGPGRLLCPLAAPHDRGTRLETIGGPNAIEVPADPMQKDIYTAFPESLNRIHDVVMEHSGDPMTCSLGEPDGSQVKVIKLEDVGIEPNEGGDGEVVMRCLDLVRSLIQDSPAQAEQLMQALETGEPVVAHTVTESQLTTMILEDALSPADPRTRTQPRPQLIISATSVLSDLLALPNCSNRVWLYIRSMTALFGDERAAGFASGALAAGRATEHYTMTLEPLHPVQQLYREAAASVLPDNPRLQQLKEDVLLRAAHFIHTEIWVEHLGWKYAQLGDRFEIGRRVTAMYLEVLEHAPPTLEERPFVALSQAVVDVLLFKATSSTITLSCRQYTLTARASGTYMQLDVLTYNQMSTAASRPGLLKEALCARISGGVSVHSPKRAEVDPIDVLAPYVKERDAGTVMPVEAPSPSTIIDHVLNQEATVAVFVRIVQHPYDGIRGGRNRRGEQLSDVNALSLTGLLNALDGVAAAEGRLLFATTNHLDRLDPALSRPGRMDVWVEFKNASKWQAEALFRNFFPSTEDDLTEAEAESTSPAPGSSFGHGSSNGSDSRPSSTLWSMSPSFSSSSVASSFLVNTPLVSHPLIAHWRHCPTVPYGSDIDDGEPVAPVWREQPDVPAPAR